MKAKHSAILLTGLLLLMIGIAWAQTSDKAAKPTCPPLKEEGLQEHLQSDPNVWVKAYWDTDMSVWQVDCTQIDSVANMALPSDAYNTNISNTATNASRPVRRPTRRPRT